MTTGTEQDQPSDTRGWPRPTLAPATDPRSSAMLVAGFLAVVLFAGMTLLPVPYAVMRPGPVRDVLGVSGGQPLISITGHETYPTSGSLDLLTVSIHGGPGGSVSLDDVLLGWLNPDVSVRSVHEIYPPQQTEEEADRESALQMESSQENATAAALGELGIAVPSTLTVAGFTEGAHAASELEESDVITAVGGERVTDLPQLREVLQQTDPGKPVEVTFTREGREQTASITTSEGSDGQTLLGVLIDPSYDFPFDVKIQIDNIGGPSAGMIFSLGIIDKLTPGELTGGQRIAGTGTIDSSGDVGPIDGIQQKLVGAERAGAEWFLAPERNCDEVVGHVPDGLAVVKVSTLHEAREAVEAIASGQGTDELPTCS